MAGPSPHRRKYVKNRESGSPFCLGLRCDIAASDFEASGASSTRCRPYAHQGLSIYLIAHYRLSLPALADLFGLCRRGTGAARPVGRRLDDPGEALPLPTLGNFRPRLCAGTAARRRTLVLALALWAVAGHPLEPERLGLDLRQNHRRRTDRHRKLRHRLWLARPRHRRRALQHQARE